MWEVSVTSGDGASSMFGGQSPAEAVPWTVPDFECAVKSLYVSLVLWEQTVDSFMQQPHTLFFFFFFCFERR